MVNEHVDNLVTEGFGHGEDFLRFLGFRDHDVTDIVIARNEDAGQRQQYTVAVTVLGNLRPEQAGS